MPEKSLRERVLGVIETGQAVMRPKWHFILKGALLIVGGVILSLALIYVASLVVFASRQGGAWFVPAFGPQGWFAFMVSLPWILIILSGLFIILLEVLVRRYSFAYRRPLLYSVLGIVVLVLLGSVVVAKTSFHGKFMRFASEHRLPGADQIYRQYGEPQFKDIHTGRVSSLLPAGFMIKNRREEPLTVKVTSKTRLAPGTVFFVGDGVVILGERKNGQIDALGIRKINIEPGIMRILK